MNKANSVTNTPQHTFIDNNHNKNNITTNLLKIVIYPSCEHTNEKQIYFFESNSHIDSPITIGRSKCSINLNFSFLSKKHCSIKYNKDINHWEIFDGADGKSSTNGTWLMINSKYEIQYESTIVKIGNNIIKISFI